VDDLVGPENFTAIFSRDCHGSKPSQIYVHVLKLILVCRYLKRKALIGEIARKHTKGTNTSNTNRADLFQAKTPEENDRR